MQLNLAGFLAEIVAVLLIGISFPASFNHLRHIGGEQVNPVADFTRRPSADAEHCKQDSRCLTLQRTSATAQARILSLRKAQFKLSRSPTLVLLQGTPKHAARVQYSRFGSYP